MLFPESRENVSFFLSIRHAFCVFIRLARDQFPLFPHHCSPVFHHAQYGLRLHLFHVDMYVLDYGEHMKTQENLYISDCALPLPLNKCMALSCVVTSAVCHAFLF